ncbi:SURF1 family protein [Sedimentitalea sp. JM2-8]|uniref:SURF1-like protein n=1 Tax=Sedimentitalea xiamensis TaxID=3050037 RepID=A0ABT7FDT7_9RHOB|nr:SURF1 family protein [Sedimentitalea xiamensis]MDK3073283.1 SURF1 family protein [Sedimentitalea xiamensis]
MRSILFLLIFGLTGVGILVGLGTWQVQRLSWKQAILAEIETRIAADPVSLPAGIDPARDKYLPVRVSGEIEPGELHVLVSVKQVGAGYRVIAPLLTGDGRRILLDRGFVAASRKADPRRTGPVTVIGNLHWPDDRTGSTPENDVAGNIWFARDIAQMAEALDSLPVLLISREEVPAEPSVRPLPVDTVGIANDHLQYAVTWYSLALIWAGMTAYFLWRGRARSESRGT